MQNFPICLQNDGQIRFVRLFRTQYERAKRQAFSCLIVKFRFVYAHRHRLQSQLSKLVQSIHGDFPTRGSEIEEIIKFTRKIRTPSW